MFVRKQDDQADTAKRLNGRTMAFVLALLAMFFMLGAQLFSLQILDTDSYASISSRNQLRMVSQPPKRGDIYDRNMEKLAGSQICFEVAVSKSQVTSDEREILARNLAKYLNDPELTADDILQTLNSGSSGYQPVIITRLDADRSQHQLAVLEEHRDELPGLLIIEEPQRYYPQGNLASHVLGQVGQISDSDESLLENYDYLLTDWVGKAGLEYTMERFTDVDGNEIGLRGEHGLRLLEVDSYNRIVRTVSDEPSVSGNALVLTIDADVQRAMEQALEETVARISQSRPKCKAGAGVLLDVKTGGVLGMASYPDYSPQDFITGITGELANYYYDEKLKPTYNRAVSGAYPIGSTFKVSTGLAALACGAIDAGTTVLCGPANWQEDKATCPKAHGTVNLKKAMAVSCNTYFEDVAAMAGIDNMYSTFKKLGYGQLTGIELSGESRGLLANPEWKALNFEGREGKWYRYDTYYMAIGQGYSYYTPLQVAQAVATVANGGVRMQPHIVDKIIDFDGEPVYQWEPRVMDDIDIPDASLELLHQAMIAVTQKDGTAYSLFGNYPITVAAKTGTAQTGLVGDDKNKDYHGWFIAFAPAENPEVAFAGIVEYGYHGNSSAGKVCKAAFDAYFGLQDYTAATLYSSVNE